MTAFTLTISAPQVLALGGSLAAGMATLLAFAFRFLLNIGRQMASLETQGEATQATLHNMQATLGRKVDALTEKVAEIGCRMAGVEEKIK